MSHGTPSDAPDDSSTGVRTTHVYAGPTDGRHNPLLAAPTRFRPRFRALSDDEKALHDAIKAKAEELERLMAQIPVVTGRGAADLPGGTPHSRYHALALTALEESVMWAVKDLIS